MRYIIIVIKHYVMRAILSAHKIGKDIILCCTMVTYVTVIDVDRTQAVGH